MLKRLVLAALFVLFVSAAPAFAQLGQCGMNPLGGKITCIGELDANESIEGKTPLVIIHGWNNKTMLFAKPELDLWGPFIEYYLNDQTLKRTFKVYFFLYYSNMVSISDLGGMLRDDLDRLNIANSYFAGKPLVILAHSMGGLVARSFMQEHTQRYGAWAGKVGGQRVVGLVTLGTPHHGTLLANGAARNWKLASTGLPVLTLLLFDNSFYQAQGPGPDKHNRSDLRHDNHDNLLDYSLFPSETNSWLEALNRLSAFDSKIIAYAGNYAPAGDCGFVSSLFQVYCFGSTILGGYMSLPNDGVVPVSSALLYNSNGIPRVRSRIMDGYNHDQIVTGIGDGVLFGSIRRDLLSFVKTGGLRPDPGMLDFNGDGRGDIFGYNSQTGEWEIYFGGTSEWFPYQSGRWASGLVVKPGDFDGDGLTDLFIYNPATGEWSKALSDGQWGFRYFSSSPWSPGWNVTVTDLDGNGLSDVFLYHPVTGQWFKCFSRGSGNGEFVYVSGRWSGGWQIYTAEFNGDRQGDLFLYNSTSGQWFKAVNDSPSTGSGSSSGSGFNYETGFWSAAWQIYPGDFSGDGLTDLLLYSYQTGQWFVATAVPGGFSYRTGYWSPGWSVETGDFDGNGLTDVFLYFPDGFEWFVMFSRPYGDFAYYSGMRNIIGSVIKWADFNGDGYSDLIEYSPKFGTAMQWVNTGFSTFRHYLNYMFPERTLMTRR